MQYKYKVTVFTPTYNRAYIIEKLYRSLQRQTYQDFEWLVVDDGSEDETQELFARWQQEENPFTIRYFKQENGGKCRAINKGLELAEGELFFTMDSDDYLTEDALEKIVRWEAELPRDQKFCGYAGNCGTSPDSPSNRLFAGGYLDGTALDRYTVVEGDRVLADGERAFVFYTDIHRKYLYPEFPGERFLTEAVTWDQMAHDGYKMRFYNDIIWIWEYQDDGLTRAGFQVFRDNPQGTGLFFRQKAEFLRYSLPAKICLWYGYATEFRHCLTNAQIAQYIDMPLWLVAPMKWLHSLVQVIKKKR